MKKVVYLVSSIAAISLLVGCGSSGSSESSSSSPSYSSTQTSVDSPQKAAQASSAAVTTISIGASVDSIYGDAFKKKKFVNISDVLNKTTNAMTNKKISFKKSHKLNLKQYVKKFANIDIEKIMDVNNSYCETNTTKQNLSNQCINGGSFYVISKIEPDGNECVATITYSASNCVLHDDYNGTHFSYESNDTVNGFITQQERSVFDENDSAITQYIVGESEQDKYTDNYIEVGVDKDNNNQSYVDKENEKADMVYSIATKYHIDSNNSVVPDNINTFKLDGNYNWDETYKEGNVSETGKFKFGSNYSEIDDYSNIDKNIIHINMNGWIDERITESGSSNNFDNNFTIAFKDYNNYLKFLLDSANKLIELDTNVSGMIGTECLGGMVGLDTEQIIDDNLTDQYDLPNSGLLKITGANNSYAVVKFFQDENGTHAEVNTSNGESKEYNTTEQLERGACNGSFVNPFDWDNSDDSN